MERDLQSVSEGNSSEGKTPTKRTCIVAYQYKDLPRGLPDDALFIPTSSPVLAYGLTNHYFDSGNVCFYTGWEQGEYAKDVLKAIDTHLTLGQQLAPELYLKVEKYHQKYRVQEKQLDSLSQEVELPELVIRMFKDTPVGVEAASLVTGERQKTYGDPTVSLNRLAKLWSALLGIEVTPRQAAHMLILLKVSRDQQQPYRDNEVDICGYAHLLQFLREADSEEEG